MEEFEIIVWYRTVRYGEIQKDFIDYKVTAENIQEAVNKVADKFNSYKSIPFAYLHDGEKYSPNNYDKKIFQ